MSDREEEFHEEEFHDEEVKIGQFLQLLQSTGTAQSMTTRQALAASDGIGPVHPDFFAEPLLFTYYFITLFLFYFILLRSS